MTTKPHPEPGRKDTRSRDQSLRRRLMDVDAIEKVLEKPYCEVQGVAIGQRVVMGYLT